MAQLRQDYVEFVNRGVEVLVIGPDGRNAYKRYWTENEMPCVGLADIRNRVADQFHQEVNWIKMGRMPAVVVVDRQGRIRYSHYGSSMSDIPENNVVLDALDALNQESG